MKKRGTPGTAEVNIQKQGIRKVRNKSGRLTGVSVKFYRRPYFPPSPEEFSTADYIHHLQVQYSLLSSKKSKKSKLFSHNIGALNTINIINARVADERLIS